MKTERPNWELIEAIALIRELNPRVLEAGHALALTGSVLFKGWSSNDLDIVAYPLRGVLTPYQKVVEIFLARFPESEAGTCTEGREQNQKIVFSLKLPDRRKIELFFPSRAMSGREDTLLTISERGS